MEIEFNNDQIYALYDIENWWTKSNEMVYNLSGAAGTGKTTLIRYFIERIGLELSDVAFLAYMGKASMQMARNGLPAQTIHSFIYRYEKVIYLNEEGKPEFDDKGKIKTVNKFILREELPKNVKLIVIDEASMVNEEIGKDLLSFGVPIIALGDLNQLPPVIGNPFFLKNPDYILTKVMRQNEDNPIIWLAHQVLNDKPLKYGIYGNSSVISKNDINEYILKNSDVVLTVTNKLRQKINDLFRENLLNLRRLDIPNEGEKIICRKNNWNRCLQHSIYLTNGMAGTIDYVDIESMKPGKSIKIDFKPDFLNKKFKNLTIDFPRLFSTPGAQSSDLFAFTRDQFEFAYAITTHLSQGSQYDNVVFLNEKSGFSKEIQKKLMYTAITRAKESITIVQ